MSETVTPEKPTTEPGPQSAPSASAQQPPETSAQPTATDKSSAAASVIEKAFPKPTESESGAESSTIRNMRRAMAEKEAENRRLREDLGNRMTAKEREPEAEDDGLHTLDGKEDHDKALEKVARSVEARVLEGIRQREAQEQHMRSAESARDWLLARPYLKDDEKFASEVVERLKDHQDVAIINPMKAARLAYEDVCRAKGVSIEAPAPSPSRAAGTRPTASQEGGKKTWTRDEIASRSKSLTPGTSEYKSFVREMEEARKEGRIK